VSGEEDGHEKCGRCGDETDEIITLHRNGRVWGRFCLECHDKLSAFAAGVNEPRATYSAAGGEQA
jgi:hypothetical protein